MTTEIIITLMIMIRIAGHFNNFNLIHFAESVNGAFEGNEKLSPIIHETKRKERKEG